MKKNLLLPFFIIMLISSSSWASKISLKVTDLKTGKVKAKITMPMWVAKMGGHLNSTFSSKESNIDVLSIIKEIEKKGLKKGPFLEIEDHAQSEKVSFFIE